MSYKKWICTVCDFIYDEEKGWPEDGIAPGTRWENVPDDWECPDCGVGKADFDMVEIVEETQDQEIELEVTASNAYAIDHTKSPIVIIGSGLAGYHLAREFRKLDQTTPLTIVTSDDGTLYSKPLLSVGFSKHKKPEQFIISNSEEMALELTANILIFSHVSEINPADNSIVVSGHRLPYSQLVFATGAECFEFKVEGNAQADIFEVNNLHDYARFRTALANKKRVMIIGAGLIGTEFANDMVQSNYEVTVIDRDKGPLSSILPIDVSNAMQSALEQAGVKYHQQSTLKSVNRVNGNLVAQLTNGQTIESDIILSAIGLKPRIALAEEAGINVNRGIVTDRLLNTNIDNIYALGDCAEVDGKVLCFVAPLSAATKALAKTLTGTPTEVYYGVMPVTVKSPLYPLIISTPPAGAAGTWEISGSDNNFSARFTSDEGELLGFLLAGELTHQKQLIPSELAPIMPAV